jgi:hypothetical protein
MWDEADPVTATIITTLGQFTLSPEAQLSALSSAIEILSAAHDLEQRLELTGEYCITGGTITKVRDRD